MDLTGLPSDMLSFEFHGYFAIDKVPNDEVSGKISVVPHHSDGDKVQCLDMGVDNHSGKCRYRFENPHPTYTDALGKEIKPGVALGSKFVGYKFIRITKGDKVGLEIWQDAGDNETKPSNQWVQLAKWEVANEHAVMKYPNGPLVTLRLDGKNVSADLKKQWLNCVEIKPI
jgi:hypothetical protein